MDLSLRTTIDAYDARGNRYGVLDPAQFAALIPNDSRIAVETLAGWGPGFLRLMDPVVEEGALDGLVIGPFGACPPFHAVIMNTDGTLAERSGNGLTIFARALVDKGLVSDGSFFEVHVHHGGEGSDPLVTPITVAEPDQAFVAFGTPSFGPAAVAIRDGAFEVQMNGGWTVHELARLDPRWNTSVFVRVGNPHSVTFVESLDDLPGFDRIRENWSVLERVAFASTPPRSSPFDRGSNLQWVAVADRHTLDAQIFERGEGWTNSSGSSASAVASAAFHLGKVDEGPVLVRMPGGHAEVVLRTDKGRLKDVIYSGRAVTLD